MVPLDACVGSLALLLEALLVDWIELLAGVDTGATLAGVLETSGVDDIDTAVLLIDFEDSVVLDPDLPPQAFSKTMYKQAAPLAGLVVLFIRTPGLLSF